MEVLFIVALIAKLLFDFVVSIWSAVKAEQINKAYKKLRESTKGQEENDQ